MHVQAARIPCDDATINEMILLMDRNADGVIGWDEFEVFMTEEFAAGKNLLSGEYVLPSGTCWHGCISWKQSPLGGLLPQMHDAIVKQQPSLLVGCWCVMVGGYIVVGGCIVVAYRNTTHTCGDEVPSACQMRSRADAAV